MAEREIKINSIEDLEKVMGDLYTMMDHIVFIQNKILDVINNSTIVSHPIPIMPTTISSQPWVMQPGKIAYIEEAPKK